MTPIPAADQAGLPPLAVGIGAAVVLAGLDLLGAWLAKEWATGSHPVLTWILGAASFVALFAVYSASLQYAELTTVTLLWIVLLQVGVMALDRFRYGTPIDLRTWLLAAAVVLLLAVMMVRPTAEVA